MGFFSKSPDKDKDVENDKWKNKYLNLLDSLELTEKKQKQDQDLLCKTIMRLSVLAAEADPKLEPHLQLIRDHIKKGVEYTQLKDDIEKLTSVLSQMEEAGISNKQNEDRKEALLFDFLRLRYSSEKHHIAFNLLQESFQLNGDTKKLFSTISSIIEDNDPGVAQVNQTENHAQTLPQSDFHTVVSDKLAQLLKQIEIPDGFIEKAEFLKQQLEQPTEAGSFVCLLDKVTLLLIDINAKNQSKEAEIDKFLNYITKQLTTLGLTLAESSIALMDASLNRSKLDQSVSEQMNDLQHRSSNATQLEPLKQVISSHLEKITKEIQEHKQKESIQREKYQNQLDELSQKIKAMELEAGDLQAKLITANTNAQRDVLTDLPNRLAYDERMKMEIARWQRYHTPLCLVIWDIDFFKKFNDQYGHQIGDKVLGHVAILFSKSIRRSDFIARFGGEEFVMLLPHTNKHSALKMAEKLRMLLEQNRLEIDELSLSITVSCGIAQFLKGDAQESAFKRADEALYRAKEGGRNQCHTG
jgi:diguanylate cyclase